MSQSHSKFLPVIDFATVILTGAIAFVLRQGWVAPEAHHIVTVLSAAIAVFVVFSYSRVYVAVGSGLATHAHRLLAPLVVAALVLVALAYATKMSTSVSRLWAGYWLVMAFVSMVAVRWAIDRVSQAELLRPWLARRIALVGAADGVAALYREINAAHQPWVEVVGLFATDGRVDALPGDVEVGDLAALLERAGELPLDEVIVAPAATDSPDVTLAQLRALQLLPVNLHVGPWELLSRFPAAERVDIAGLGLINVSRQPLPGSARALKWVEDRVLSGLLVLLLSPLLLLIALAVKLDSAGPVLFRQQRYGFGKQVFTVYKFRTMSMSSDDDLGVTQATPRDPRCTRVGRFLRRFSLDELPQLFNVLGGSMSLVGPRPHALPHDDHYADLIDSYLARHRVKPGITGWAQAHGRRGPTDTIDKMEDRVAHDLFYVEHWSLMLDLEILLRTVVVVLFGRNAV